MAKTNLIDQTPEEKLLVEITDLAKRSRAEGKSRAFAEQAKLNQGRIEKYIMSIAQSFTDFCVDEFGFVYDQWRRAIAKQSFREFVVAKPDDFQNLFDTALKRAERKIWPKPAVVLSLLAVPVIGWRVLLPCVDGKPSNTWKLVHNVRKLRRLTGDSFPYRKIREKILDPPPER